jgi:hypothetical protein
MSHPHPLRSLSHSLFCTIGFCGGKKVNGEVHGGRPRPTGAVVPRRRKKNQLYPSAERLQRKNPSMPTGYEAGTDVIAREISLSSKP